MNLLLTAKNRFKQTQYLQKVICAAIGSPLKSNSMSKNLPCKQNNNTK